MKIIIALVSVFVALQSYAGNIKPYWALTNKDEWDVILGRIDIKVQAHTLQMPAGEHTISSVPITEVCAPNDYSYETINPQNILETYQQNGRSVERYARMGKLVGSNIEKSMYQDPSNRSNYIPVYKVVEREQKVEVLYKISGSSSGPVKLFDKDYRIPDCLELHETTQFRFNKK